MSYDYVSRLVQSATGCQPTTGIGYYTFSSRGSEYSTSQVTGSSFLASRGFRIVDLRVQTSVFAVSGKPEVVVSRPEVILRDRKWLLPTQIQRLRSRRVLRSFLFRLRLHYFCLCIGSARSFGLPLQVTVRHMLRDRCPVCQSINQSINQFLKWPKWHSHCKDH